MTTFYGKYLEDDILVLSSHWHLRPNNGGGLVYAFSYEENKQLFLSAFETLAIALCDGQSCLAQVVSLLSTIVELDRQNANQIVQTLLKRSEASGPFLILLSEAQGQFNRVNITRILRELSAPTQVNTETRRLDVPLSLLLQPSYHCATNCIYCYAERPALPLNSYMKTSRWVEILTEAGELGVDLISFGGGDPLTYDGIDYLLKTASIFGMKYLLPTKTFVTRTRALQLAQLLANHGQIQISVDSFENDIADRMTGVRGYAKRARASIIHLISAGLSVQTNTVVTPLNISGIEKLIRQLRQLGVSRANITNYGRSHYRHNDDLFLDPEQMAFLNELIGKLIKELKWPELSCNAGSRDFSLPGNNNQEAWQNRSSCSGGFSSFTILPNGDIILCEQMPHNNQFVVGNVARKSLMEVWDSTEVRQFISPKKHLFAGTACADCEEFDICHRVYGRCFRDAMFNYGSIYSPSPNCPRAPLGIRMG
jgi:radical SAM protein with 4Fe4S-binding SPASM domain